MNDKPKKRNIHIPKSLRHQTPLEGKAKGLKKISRKQTRIEKIVELYS